MKIIFIALGGILIASSATASCLPNPMEGKRIRLNVISSKNILCQCHPKREPQKVQDTEEKSGYCLVEVSGSDFFERLTYLFDDSLFKEPLTKRISSLFGQSKNLTSVAIDSAKNCEKLIGKDKTFRRSFPCYDTGYRGLPVCGESNSSKACLWDEPVEELHPDLENEPSTY